KDGAHSYIPKDMMTDIPVYVKDILEAHRQGIKKHGRWFERLKPFFDKKFGQGWRKKDPEFWEEFDKAYSTRVSKDELETIM
ncbi:MAG: response regulator, partial [Pseudomonadota bacterium]